MNTRLDVTLSVLAGLLAEGPGESSLIGRVEKGIATAKKAEPETVRTQAPAKKDFTKTPPAGSQQARITLPQLRHLANDKGRGVVYTSPQATGQAIVMFHAKSDAASFVKVLNPAQLVGSVECGKDIHIAIVELQ